MSPEPEAHNTPWVPSVETMGARLALVRWKMQWNLKEASLACGLKQNQWAQYEAGVRPRDPLEVVSKIAARTGVDAMWLLAGERARELGENASILGLNPVTLRYQGSSRHSGRLAQISA